VLFAPAAALPALVFGLLLVEEPVVAPFIDGPVVVPLAAGPPAAELPPAVPLPLCANAIVVDIASAVASPIVESLMRLSLGRCPKINCTGFLCSGSSQHRVVNSLTLARAVRRRWKSGNSNDSVIWTSAFLALLIVEVLLVLL
jgi:hypothetical protein